MSPGDVPTSPHTHRPESPVGRPEPLTLAQGAIGQLEAPGTEALVGASRVFALASQAAALEVFTFIHICRSHRGTEAKGSTSHGQEPRGRSLEGLPPA